MQKEQKKNYPKALELKAIFLQCYFSIMNGRANFSANSSGA
jgi:hypothetical protein